MNEIEVFTSLINTVGFPIATSAALFYLAHGTIKENTEAIRELRNEIQRNYE